MGVLDMKASIVDLRYKMNDVLKALARNEEVEILYRGEVRGVIKPALVSESKKIEEHALFGMHKAETRSVEEVMQEIRGDH
jgi:hypothetical protein